VPIALPDTFTTTRGFKRRARSFVIS
jgi:hypothetical protein